MDKILERKQKIIDAMVRKGFRTDCYEFLVETPKTIKVALISNEDYEKILDVRHSIGSRGYLESKRGKLHRLIMSAKPGQTVDHINRKIRDNRRCNLRFVDRQQHAWNRKKVEHSSKYKCVWRWNGDRKNPWGVRVNRKYIGSYATEEEAAKAANKAMLEIQGEYANLNQIKKV